MRTEYNFKNAIKNPYAARLKKQVPMRFDNSVLEYFKQLSKELDLPYQTPMNAYLRECVALKKRPLTKWVPKAHK